MTLLGTSMLSTLFPAVALPVMEPVCDLEEDEIDAQTEAVHPYTPQPEIVDHARAIRVSLFGKKAPYHPHARRVEPAPLHELESWVGRADESHHETLFATAQDMRDQYANLSLRLQFIEDHYEARISPDAAELRARYEFLCRRYASITEELSKPRVFPNVTRLNAQLKRMEILHAQLKELALEIAEEAELARAGQSGTRRRTWRKRSDDQKDTGIVSYLFKKIKALLNKRRREYGGLEMREHQYLALKAIEADFSLSEESRAFKEDLLIGLPTGSGKTLIMAGCVPMAERRGWVDFQKGDKIIITTHLQTVTRQDREAMEALFGHRLSVSVYGEGEHDLSGDIVIVSIPTFTAQGKSYKLEDLLRERPELSGYTKTHQERVLKERRLEVCQERFLQELRGQLGETGSVRMLLQDEVHHEEAPTWQALDTALRGLAEERGQDLKKVGFTGTPTRAQRSRGLTFERSAKEMFQTHVLPEAWLVRHQYPETVRGGRISKVTGDYVEASLGAINTKPIRRWALAKLVEDGVRREDGRGFEPVLGFCINVKHAKDMAKEHAEFFGETNPGEPEDAGLFDRNIAVIGDRTSLKQLNRMIANQEHNGIHTFVAVVSANTGTAVFNKILELHKAGVIEAVYSCKKLEEGFDGPHVRTSMGLRPTLSWIQKAQEAGRIMRRERKEVSRDGKILEEPRRVLMDFSFLFASQYQPMRYEHVLGKFDRVFEEGVLYSMRRLQPVDAEAEDKERERARRRRQTQRQRPKQMREANERWGEYASFRETLIHLLYDPHVYAGDSMAMAGDLAMDEDDLLDLLTNSERYVDYRTLQAFEILLYLPQGALTRSKSNYASETMSQGVLLDILETSLQFYLGVVDKPWRPVAISYQVGDESLSFVVAKTMMTRSLLRRHEFKEAALLTLGQALYYEFERLVDDDDFAEQRASIKKEMDHLRQALNAASPLVAVRDETAYLGGRLYWDNTEEGIRRVLSDKPEADRAKFIEDWFLASHPGANPAKIPEELYIQAGAHGFELGKIAKGVQLLTRDELLAYQAKASDKHPHVKITKKAGEERWTVPTGKERVVAGARAPQLSNAFFVGGVIDDVMGMAVAETKFYEATGGLKPSELMRKLKTNADGLRDLLFLVLEEKDETELYVVGGSGGIKRGSLVGGLRILTKEQYQIWKRENYNYKTFPRFKIDKDEATGNWKVTTGPKRHVKGPFVAAIIDLFHKSDAIPDLMYMNEDEREFQRKTKMKTLEQLTDCLREDGEGLRTLFFRILEQKNVDEIYLVVGAGGISRGGVSEGVRMLTKEQFEAWVSEKDRRSYPVVKITKHRPGDQWELPAGDDRSITGNLGVDFGDVYFRSGIVKDVLGMTKKERALQRATGEKPDVLAARLRTNEDGFRDQFLEVLAEKDVTELIITTGSNGVLLSSGKISIGISVLTPSQYAAWWPDIEAHAKKYTFPRIRIVYNETLRRWEVPNDERRMIKGVNQEEILGMLVQGGVVVDLG